jgi:hypothetical protein
VREEDFFLDREYSFDYLNNTLFGYQDDGTIWHRIDGLNPYFS